MTNKNNNKNQDHTRSAPQQLGERLFGTSTIAEVVLGLGARDVVGLLLVVGFAAERVVLEAEVDLEMLTFRTPSHLFFPTSHLVLILLPLLLSLLLLLTVA